MNNTRGTAAKIQNRARSGLKVEVIVDQKDYAKPSKGIVWIRCEVLIMHQLKSLSADRPELNWYCSFFGIYYLVLNLAAICFILLYTGNSALDCDFCR